MRRPCTGYSGRAMIRGWMREREELKNEAVYIEDYVDIVCYTKMLGAYRGFPMWLISPMW